MGSNKWEVRKFNLDYFLIKSIALRDSFSAKLQNNPSPLYNSAQKSTSQEVEYKSLSLRSSNITRSDFMLSPNTSSLAISISRGKQSKTFEVSLKEALMVFPHFLSLLIGCAAHGNLAKEINDN